MQIRMREMRRKRTGTDRKRKRGDKVEDVENTQKDAGRLSRNMA